MDMPANVLDTVNPGPNSDISSAFNQAFDQKASDQFNDDFDQGIRQHGRIMALFEGFVKRGRTG